MLQTEVEHPGTATDQGVVIEYSSRSAGSLKSNEHIQHNLVMLMFVEFVSSFEKPSKMCFLLDILNLDASHVNW